MTQNTITIIVGILQIILSINLIIRRKNRLAIVSEIISSLILLYYLNEFSIEVRTISWTKVGIVIAEYLCVKIFLVIFMLIARYSSFYIIRAICRNNQKVKFAKLKFVRHFWRVKYWPKLKLGLPGMANKTHPKTKVKFDSKGFPKFKVYYTVKLNKEYFRETRERHFYMANTILSEQISYNRILRKKFSNVQIKEILDGKTPSGYTWHHHQDAGVLQLVDENLHSKTYHIGGYTIWGSK